jgi:hypothetical protein
MQNSLAEIEGETQKRVDIQKESIDIAARLSPIPALVSRVGAPNRNFRNATWLDCYGKSYCSHFQWSVLNKPSQNYLLDQPPAQ